MGYFMGCIYTSHGCAHHGPLLTTTVWYFLQSSLLYRWSSCLSPRATSSSLQITAKLQPVIHELRELGISVKYDDADNKRPGFKFADYELKGVPVRLVMGGRDLEKNTIEMMRRDTLGEGDTLSSTASWST